MGSETLELYPFRFRWPKQYWPEGKGYLLNVGMVDSVPYYMGRYPINRPRTPSASRGLSTDNKKFYFSNPDGAVCLKTIGTALRRPGPNKVLYRKLSVVYGLLGSDSCIQTPNFKVNAGGDLEIGLQMKHTMFDPEQVDVMSLLALIPPR